MSHIKCTTCCISSPKFAGQRLWVRGCSKFFAFAQTLLHPDLSLCLCLFFAVKFFSHEASDLEPTLKLLQGQDPQAYDIWETRYILLLWLSILALVPFDLKNIDSSTTEHNLVRGILDVGKGYLAAAGKEREAAALLVAKLLTRFVTHLILFGADHDKQTSIRTCQAGCGQGALWGLHCVD